MADTHVGEHLPALPPEVAEVLGGVDMILHAGDLTDVVVLEQLGRIAPVVAVRGNHDEEAGIGGLPRDAVIEAGGRRIGLTHGARTKAVELPAAALSLLTARTVLLGFEGAMRRRFGDVDCVVVGHLHMPIHRMVDGALLFSPGAVFIPELDPGYSWTSLPARGYRRFRDRLPPAARTPGVGLIEAGPSGLTARVIPLRRPLRAVR
ncbi:MAG TPA: metallophosphoesterase family protein [Miltoncostaeaceae bacterium]|nr:metallophosphoesterase family protein [Miltoncostaeaceae bacterium]